MTPNDVELLIHFHCCRAPHPRVDAPACRDAVAWMLTEDLIVTLIEEKTYCTTDRGAKLVDMICSTPLPVPPTEQWIDPREES